MSSVFLGSYKEYGAKILKDEQKPEALDTRADIDGETPAEEQDAGNQLDSGQMITPNLNVEAIQASGASDPKAYANRNEHVKKEANNKTFIYAQGPPRGFDEYGEELGKNARVWKTYVQEASRYDADLVDGWNRSLDLILIFAALFSAISTAFVIESSKALQPDPTETSAQTLSTISQTLLLIANAQPGSTLNPAVPEPVPFAAPSSAVCVNVLWFLSLSLSVAVSLIAMLGKDWARAYMANRTGQPYQQARMRQQRWDSLAEWKMPQVIMFLPTLLHLALLMFAVGLTVYLWNIHIGTAIPVLLVTLIAMGMYTALTILPLVYENCPYGTPLSSCWPDQSGRQKLWLWTCRLGEITREYLISSWKSFKHWTRGRPGFAAPFISAWRRLGLWLSRVPLSDPESTNQEDLVMDNLISWNEDDDLMNELTSRALAWLIDHYEDNKSVDIALQALAGADIRLPWGPLEKCDAVGLLHQRMKNCLAVRQRTREWYLKHPSLLEAATLYGRALLANMEYPRTKSYNTEIRFSICLLEHTIKLNSHNPTHAAFSLAVRLHSSLPDGVNLAVWDSRARSILESYFDDKIILADAALLVLLDAVAYRLANEASEDRMPLILTLVRALSVLGPLDDTVAGFKIAVALTASIFSIQREAMKDIQSSDCHEGINEFLKRSQGCHPRHTFTETNLYRVYALLELLKHSEETLQDADLVNISRAISNTWDRPDHYKLHAMNVVQAPGYNLRCLKDDIVPRVRPMDDGTFAKCELVRAGYLAVINRQFLATLPNTDITYICRLTLQNLLHTVDNNLKRVCCEAFTGFSLTLQKFDHEAMEDPIVQHSVEVLHLFTSLFPALLSGLESSDDRIAPYLMSTIWSITASVLASSMLDHERLDLLQSVLSCESFTSAVGEQNDSVSLPTSVIGMGYLEAWLPRLESIQDELLGHICDSGLLHWFNMSLAAQSSDKDSEILRRANTLQNRAWTMYRIQENRDSMWI